MFVEPNFAKVGSNIINLTTISEDSNILNESLMSKTTKKAKRGDVSIF